MLQSIREKATGWIAYIIIIGISIPFAFWGIDQYFAGGTNTVAIVDSEKISNERLTLIYRDKLKDKLNVQLKVIFMVEKYCNRVNFPKIKYNEKER